MKMTDISRKEFLTKGMKGFGLDLYRAACAKDPPAGNGNDLTAYASLLVDNRRCLAQRGGCFCCIDHCPQEAIGIQLGVGIAIDADLCDSCGLCIDSCPVEPKVIAFKPTDLK